MGNEDQVCVVLTDDKGNPTFVSAACSSADAEVLLQELDHPKAKIVTDREGQATKTSMLERRRVYDEGYEI